MAASADTNEMPQYYQASANNGIFGSYSIGYEEEQSNSQSTQEETKQNDTTSAKDII